MHSQEQREKYVATLERVASVESEHSLGIGALVFVRPVNNETSQHGDTENCLTKLL